MKELEELEGEIYQVQYRDDYIGEGDKRRKVKNTSVIVGVKFLLSPQEWCDLCMRDGDHYMGHCCGNTSAIQDALNGVFRDGGSVSAREAWELIRLGETHEGFETWAGTETEANLRQYAKDWEEIDPVTKIGLALTAVRSRLDLSQVLTARPDAEREYQALSGALTTLRYQDMFEYKNPEQKHANEQLHLAKVIPAAKRLLAAAEGRLNKPFEGYAIAIKGTEQLLSDQMGYLFYPNKKIAERRLAEERESAKKYEHLEKELKDAVVRKVRVSAKEGLVFQD